MPRSRGVLYSICFLVFLFSLPAFAADTDSDGLADDVELQLGSSPTHKDIFVYINYMIWNGKNLRPRGNFIKIVQSVFSTAPISNPDGTTGINLHVQIGPAIRTTNGIVGEMASSGSYYWTEFDSIKNQYFPADKRSTHHYCLFAGDIGGVNGESTGISGYSRNGGAFRQGASDSIVALGHPGWFNYPKASLYKWTQAGTFLHELGHNLGLQHGGGDHISYKPNHLSLMSYAYQTDGVPINIPGDGDYYLYDYARFAGPNLNEGNLNENAGMGAKLLHEGVYYGARWWYLPDYEAFAEVFDATSGIDWNYNGAFQSGVRFNLNQLFDEKTVNLRGGVNEWSRVYFRGGQIGKAALQSKAYMPDLTSYPCMKVSERKSKSILASKNITRITFEELRLKKH